MTSDSPFMSPSIRRVCVYCAANNGAHPTYLHAATALGALIAEQGITLLYGGARIGLMGALADAALKAGGDVIGVMPHGLVEREVAHQGLTTLHVVDTMHERKALLASEADAFIAMPGGLGTLEELFETWTWAQLGVHRKPIGLLNPRSFWHPLLSMMNHMTAEGFLRGNPLDWLLVDADPASLLARMGTFVPPDTRKWLRMDET